jgi:hypothetical protein
MTGPLDAQSDGTQSQTRNVVLVTGSTYGLGWEVAIRIAAPRAPTPS